MCFMSRLQVVNELADAASETAVLEDAAQKLSQMRTPGLKRALDARVGAVLVARNVKVGDLMREWDDDGSGTIDAKEFRQHLKGLQLAVTAKECNDFFGSLDENGDGELTMDEMKHALKKMQEAAAEVVANEKSQAKYVKEKRTAVRIQQNQALARLDMSHHDFANSEPDME